MVKIHNFESDSSELKKPEWPIRIMALCLCPFCLLALLVCAPLMLLLAPVIWCCSSCISILLGGNPLKFSFSLKRM